MSTDWRTNSARIVSSFGMAVPILSIMPKPSCVAKRLGRPSPARLWKDYSRRKAATGWTSSCSPAHISRRSEEHTSELQSLMRISYAVFCLKKKKNTHKLHVYEHGQEIPR